jgi:hypothetical protein
MDLLYRTKKFTELGLTKGHGWFLNFLGVDDFITELTEKFGAPKKFNKLPSPLFSPKTNNTCYQKPNPSR